MGWLNSGEQAGRKADKRWDNQVEIAFAAANDQRDYTTDNLALSYNDAVLGNEIQKENLARVTDWQETTAMRAWDAEAKERVFEFNSQVAAYNKAERLFGAQVELNKYARGMARISATDVARERLDALKFQGMEANLKSAQTKSDITQQGLSTDLKIGKQRSDINLQKQAATLERQGKMAEAAFGSEQQLVELMQAAGKAGAKGQVGGSAQKNIQAIMATGGRAQAQLADQITRGTSAYNLSMMGLDKSLISGETEAATAQSALTTKAAYADLASGLGAEQRDASRLSAQAAYGRAMNKAEFDEYGANLAADAKRMAEPGFAPLPPKPLELPEAILMDPMLPMDLPEVRKGAGSGGVGAAQGRAQDIAMIVNAFTSILSAGIGGAMACDMRVKHEVASLEYTEVNDALAMLAFAVKELREHS